MSESTASSCSSLAAWPAARYNPGRLGDVARDLTLDTADAAALRPPLSTLRGLLLRTGWRATKSLVD